MSEAAIDKFSAARGRPFRKAVAIMAAGLGLAGCGSNAYQAWCTLRINTESLQHGVTRAQAIADCEREQARQHPPG